MTGIAAQTRVAIAHAATLTDDRRRLIIIGRPEVIDELRRAAGERWRPAPACFRPAELVPWVVVGSFDGVPVAEFDDAPETGGLGIVLGDKSVAGVTRFEFEGFFTSWHVADGKMTTHAERCRTAALQ